MGRVYDEFAQELDGWRRQYTGQLQEELIHLLLLALEREELVTIAYREEVILRRLASMPISDEIRELIHHALIWVWKDEAMHSIYIRGAIFKFGNWRLQAFALLRQMAGAVGGWSASMRQHIQWSEAPIPRLLATITTGLGSIAGRIPHHVREHLDYRSFRDYCLFNIDAERTAWLCFKRLIEIIESKPSLPSACLPTYIDDFRRVQADEDRHRSIFEIFAGCFDDEDRLMTRETVESIAQKIGTVGEFFLPRAWRNASVAENTLGSGGRVWAVQGTMMAEKLPLFRRLLDESGLARLLQERARLLGKKPNDLRIAIKPTFIFGYHRQDRSPITDPELLKELACYLDAQGCKDIAVVEGRNIYDKFYQHRVVHDVASYFGIDSPYFRVVDVSEEQVSHQYTRGMGQYTVGRTWKEADFRITFGKMRSHPVELVYLTVGNIESIGARCDEFVFVERQAHRETATMMLLDEFPPHFALLDAYELAADGVVGIMGCSHPPSPKRFYAGVDALAVDVVAARHMGVKDPRQSRTLRAACHWFGNPDGQIEVVGTDEPVAGWRSPRHNDLSALLSFASFPIYVFGSARGSLFVPEMDGQAFPSLTCDGWLLRLGRKGVQALLGLRLQKK